MLNKRSNHLVILVATYNRLQLLKAVLDSILAGTKCSHEIIVIDGGSTDGTVEYLQSESRVTPVFQGKLLGTARCYNEVWRQVESRYTCWLSDDTEITSGSLDLAISAIEDDPTIGMVGLKMKDTIGPGKRRPYGGAISEYGILNCNHGVLSTSLLASIGYFNEAYRSYTIDPDLTASVLCAGRKVVMTKQISVLHHREWATHEGTDKVTREMGGIDNVQIYHDKFNFLEASTTPQSRAKKYVAFFLKQLMFYRYAPDALRFGLSQHDWKNIADGRFIRLTDFLENRHHSYHLTQQIPPGLLISNRNPYRHLVIDGKDEKASQI